MSRLSPQFWDRFESLIRARTGLSAARRDQASKERIVMQAMEALGTDNEYRFLEQLAQDRQVFAELISDFTVPESYFFRDPPHYEMLRREVLPELTAARSSEHVWSLWSAGCAGGEEPYSLAILLDRERLLERSFVVGSDVSERALARAVRGLYGEWSLRALERESVERYFIRQGTKYELVSRIREAVRFRLHSLSGSHTPAPAPNSAGFDLVLCRNVLIYFETSVVHEVAERLARSLAPGGFLLLGPSDPPLRLERWCDLKLTAYGALFRKRASGARSHSSRELASPMAPAAPVHARPSQAEKRALAPTPRPPAPAPAPATADRELPRTPRPAELTEQLHRIHEAHGALVAEAACRDAIGTAPLSAELHFMHASLLLELGRVTDAEAALRRALYLDRSLVAAQLMSAAMAESRGDHECAFRAYAQIVTLCGEQPAQVPVPLVDPLTHGDVKSLAAQRLSSLKSRGT